jgi:hypothetical protein
MSGWWARQRLRIAATIHRCSVVHIGRREFDGVKVVYSAIGTLASRIDVDPFAAMWHLFGR